MKVSSNSTARHDPSASYGPQSRSPLSRAVDPDKNIRDETYRLALLEKHILRENETPVMLSPKSIDVNEISNFSSTAHQASKMYAIEKLEFLSSRAAERKYLYDYVSDSTTSSQQIASNLEKVYDRRTILIPSQLKNKRKIAQMTAAEGKWCRTHTITDQRKLKLNPYLVKEESVPKLATTYYKVKKDQ